MQRQLVFQEKKEMERLCVQNSLLSCCEAPVFAQIFSEHSDMGVLDIGCNDGTKTVERFSSEKVAKVIGLEYNAELAARAQQAYGDEKFLFYPFDVEASDFSNLENMYAERVMTNSNAIAEIQYILDLEGYRDHSILLLQFLDQGSDL